MFIQEKSSRTFLLIIVLLLTTDAAFADENALRENAKVGWGKIEKATRVTNANYTYANTNNPQGKQRHSDRWAVQDRLQKTESVSKVKLCSGDRSYVLAKNDANAWQIAKLSDSADSNLVNITPRRTAAISVSGLNLLDALKDPNYEFSGWRQIENELIEFNVKNLEEARLNASVGVGKHQPAAFELITVKIDPGSNCRVVESVQDSPRQPNGDIAHVVTNYKYASDPFLPSEVKMVSTVSGSRSYSFEVTNINDSISHARLPKAEFTLQRYGLSEVFQDTIPTWYWALGAIVLIACAAAFARRYFRN